MGDVIKVLALGLLLSVGFASVPFAADQRAAGAGLHGDVARGREISERWCMSCHRIDSATLNDQVPSFTSLAASSRTEAAIRGFLTRPHSPMPPLSLSNQQIEDVVAFLNTLKQ